MVGVEVVQGDVVGRVHRGQTGTGTRVHQVPGDFSLPIHRHVFAGQLVQIDAVLRAAKTQRHAAMHQAFTLQARTHTRLVE